LFSKKIDANLTYPSLFSRPTTNGPAKTADELLTCSTADLRSAVQKLVEERMQGMDLSRFLCWFRVFCSFAKFFFFNARERKQAEAVEFSSAQDSLQHCAKPKEAGDS